MPNIGDGQTIVYSYTEKGYVPANTSTPELYDSRYVRKDSISSQTLAGPIVLPANGLNVGGNQLVTSSGRVGIGRSPITHPLEVQGSVLVVGDVLCSGSVYGNGANLSGVNAVSYLGANAPTAAEFNRLAGVTAPIQTQLDAKVSSQWANITGGISYSNNVGLGTDTLPYRLNIVGDVNVTGSYRVNGAILGTTFANPTSLVGLIAVNGSAITAMRSDAAPALDQSISPTWSGTHTFAAAKIVTPDIGANTTQRHSVPAVASDTLALLTASQALTNKTVNGLTISPTTGVLVISNAKTLTVQNTITLNASTDGLTSTIPASGTSAMGAATLSTTTANNVTGANHTHAITTSSIGAASTILATDGSGYLQLTRLGIGVAPTQPLEVGGNVFVNAATANLYLKDTNTGWQSSSTLIVTLQSNNSLRSSTFTSGLVGFNIPSTGSNVEFADVTIRGAIRSAVLVYNALLATAGTQGTFKASAKLRADVTVPAAPTYNTTTVSIDVVDQEGLSHAASQLFAVGDVLELKDGLVGDTWFQVTAVSDQTTFWRYTAKIMAGTANVTYRSGLAVADYGASGSGFIIQTADRANAPYLQMATHLASFTSQDAAGTLSATPQLRLGNLNGSYGYSANTYGLGAGQYGAVNTSWITVDQTNGLRIGSNTTTLAQWNIVGVITIGQVSAGQSNIYISAGSIQLRVNTTARIQLNSDGSGFLANSNITFNTAGVTTISGWTINSSSIASGGITLAASSTAANNKIYSGTGTFAAAATGFYLDGSGRFSLKDRVKWDGTNWTIGIVGGPITLTFTNLVNGSFTSGTFNKTAGGNAWNAGFSSIQSLNGDGYIQWTSTTQSTETQIGLSTSDPDAAQASIQYGWYMSSSAGPAAYALLSGVNQSGGAGHAYSNPATFKIERTGTDIKFYINGVLKHTVNGATADPLFVDTSIFQSNGYVPPISMETPSSSGYFNFDGTTVSVAGTINALGGTINGVLQITSTSGALAIGTTAPTSATQGTGIWIDRTGLYGLASDTQQIKIDAATGKLIAGSGKVKIDSSGIVLASDNVSVNTLAWTNSAGTAYQGWLYVLDGGGNLPTNSNNGRFEVSGSATNIDSSVSLMARRHFSAATSSAGWLQVRTSSTDARAYFFNSVAAIPFKVVINGWWSGSDPVQNTETPTPNATLDVRGDVYVLNSLGIGVVSPSYTLQLATDSAAKPSTNVWTVASDSRLKENVRPFTHGLDVINKLRPVSYKYNGLGGMPVEEGVGFIAQEVLTVYRNMVRKSKARLRVEDKDEIELLSLNSNDLTYMIVNALQELDRRTRALETKRAAS